MGHADGLRFALRLGAAYRRFFTSMRSFILRQWQRNPLRNTHHMSDQNVPTAREVRRNAERASGAPDGFGLPDGFAAASGASWIDLAGRGFDLSSLEDRIIAGSLAAFQRMSEDAQRSAPAPAILEFDSLAQIVAPFSQRQEDAARPAVAAAPQPHVDAGKVVARPARTYAGVEVEDVRQADGSVARRPVKPTTE